jgi:hypothetical protein
VGSDLYGIDVETGEVLIRFHAMGGGGIEVVTYDPLRDVVWETDGDPRALMGWCANGTLCDPPDTSFGSGGLAFDGVDLWHCTGERLPPPAPSGQGFIFPAARNGVRRRGTARSTTTG